MSLYHITAAEAGIAVTIIWIGIAIGSPLAGWWSNNINRRCIPLIVCSMLGLVASIGVIYTGAISHFLLSISLFVYGLAASSQVVTFGIVLDNNRDNNMGTAVGFNNMAVVMGGLLLQPLVGFILDHVWNGKMMGDLPFYTPHSFRIAFIMIPLCHLLGILVAGWLIEETHCVRKYPTFQEKTN